MSVCHYPWVPWCLSILCFHWSSTIVLLHVNGLWVRLTACCSLLTLLSCQEVTGPICYNCPRTDNPALCRESQTCTANQVCSVQEITAPHGDVYFWSGCEDTEVCSEMSETGTSSVIIGKRQSSVYSDRCMYCCSSDLCNRNCTSFVNLALHRPAYQSSVSWNGTADLAVDGGTDKNYFHGSCTHTGTGTYPWWAVDLGHEFTITRVKIYERNDAGADGRTFHLNILVSSFNATALDRNSHLFSQCGYYYGHSSDGDVIRIDCPKNTTGRWIRIQQSDPHFEYMHLCEVEVFGY